MRIARSFFIALVLVLMSGAVPGQVISSPYAGRAYLRPLIAAERAAPQLPVPGELDKAPRANPGATLQLATLRSYVGDTDGAISVIDRSDILRGSEGG